LGVKFLFVALLAVVAVGCGDDNEPSLRASSDSDGVLEVSGSGWTGCDRVVVELPEPWASSEGRVERGGRFSLVYAHPEVEPYRGIVRARCTADRELQAEAQIRVGDSRARQ
jgi:hypothetical protein